MKLELGEKVTVALSLPTTVKWHNRSVAEMPEGVLLGIFPRIAGRTGHVTGHCSCGCGWPQVVFDGIQNKSPYSIPYEALEDKYNPLAWPE